MPTTTPLHELSIAQAGSMLRAGNITSMALTEHALSRVASLDPLLHAFVLVTKERAMADAARADRELKSGTDKGPLHGIPYALKDIYETAGIRTTCHSKLLADHVPAADCVVETKLRAGGAVLIGKLATHEFAIGGPSFDLPFPPARNPWNRDHFTGGSSSGSGAAVAADLVRMAMGSDTGGSIRGPATYCGIVGLKPTYGLVSRRGVFPLAFTLDHVGPLTRTVADCALLLDAIAGHDPADPGSAPSTARYFGRDLIRGIRDLRVGFVRHFHETDMPANPEVTAALEDAARVLQAEGAVLRDVTLPSLNEFAAVNRVILGAEAFSIHAPWLRGRPGDYGQLTRQRLLAGAFYSGADYVGAQRRRAQMIAAVDEAFRDFDVLLCASSLDPASRLDDPVETARTYPRQARTPFNVTGHPALAMMSGLSGAGLPLSVQFVGRYFEDATVLRVAAAYERGTEWHKLRPPIA